MTHLVPLAEVNQELQRNLTASRADNTQRVYDQAWQRFGAFASAHDASPMPADPLLVGQYLSMIGNDCSPSTVRTHAAAISARHRDAGHESPCRHAGVKRTIEGHSRRRGRGERQAKPIDLEAFARIRETASRARRARGGLLETEEQARARAELDVALIGTMRDAMLRRSEAAALTWGNIEPFPDGSGRLTIERSKTDQTGEGSVCYLSPATMAALDRLDRGRDSVFNLSESQICRRIQAAARAAGLGSGYSGHSPRIGMAIDLARAGTDLTSMMVAGRWQSPRMPARYCRGEAAGSGAVARLYAAAVKVAAALAVLVMVAGAAEAGPPPRCQDGWELWEADCWPTLTAVDDDLSSVTGSSITLSIDSIEGGAPLFSTARLSEPVVQHFDASCVDGGINLRFAKTDGSWTTIFLPVLCGRGWTDDPQPDR